MGAAGGGVPGVVEHGKDVNNVADDESPQRRFTIEMEVGGDTLEDAVSVVKDFLRHLQKGSRSCITGGYRRCGEFTVVERPDVTHESFFAALEKYMIGERT